MTLRPDTSKLNLSFSGCAFLGVYHIGVCSAIRDHARWLYEGKPIAGASAGAIVAAGLITEVPLDVGLSLVTYIANKAREHALGPFNPSFNIVQYLRDGLNTILPENAHEICNNRLHVSLTRVWDRKNVLVSEYRSKQDLIQALICSAFVPFYCGMIPPEFRGERYMDGSLSDNLPILNSDTITIAPFAGETDICPDDEGEEAMHVTVVNTSMQCNLLNLYRLSRALFPPGPDAIERICRRGFEDALRYLYRNRLISCDSHSEAYLFGKLNESRLLTLPSQSTCDENEMPSDGDSERSVVKFQLEDDPMDEETQDEPIPSPSAIEQRRIYSRLLDEWRCAAERDRQFGLNPHCKNCHSRVQLALSDEIPQRITDVFHSTTLEETLKLQNNNPSAFQLLTMPYMVPLDYSIAVSKFVMNTLGIISRDLQANGGHLFSLLYEVLDYVKKQSSIKFRCELRISEFLQPFSSRMEAQARQRPLGPAFSSPVLSDSISLSPISLSPITAPYRSKIAASRRVEISVDFEAKAQQSASYPSKALQ